MPSHSGAASKAFFMDAQAAEDRHPPEGEISEDQAVVVPVGTWAHWIAALDSALLVHDEQAAREVLEQMRAQYFSSM